MERVELGDVSVSRVIYGIFRLLGHEEALPALVDVCLEHGVTTFDHADIYGGYECEAMFGRQVDPRLRPRLELVSKCGIKLVAPARPHHRVKSYDTSTAHILESVDQSLRNLRTDWLDILLIHRPSPLMDADAVAEAVVRLRQAGKIRAFGVSNFLPMQFDLLQSRLTEPLVTNQIEAHPLRSSVFFDGTLDHAQLHRYRPMIWSPLAGGRIAENTGLMTVLDRLARELGTTVEGVLIAWLQRHPAGLVPVIGTSREQRLRDILAAPTVSLDDEGWFEILQAGMGQEIP